MADIQIQDDGTIILFTPMSPEGKEWVEENLSLESWQWMGRSFAVEDQYADAVINSMTEDGLDVDHGRKTAAVVAPPAAASTAPVAQQPQRVGESVAVGEEPQEHERKTVPPELPNALFHMAGRGGWHRVSMFTIQSDDKRFTITEIDPTRRKNWFLLKDLETGLAYEETTMTGAKTKAKLIRDKAPLEDDTEVIPEDAGSEEPVQEVTEAIAEVVPELTDVAGEFEELAEKQGKLKYKNPLLASRSHEKFVDRRMNDSCLGCGNTPCTCKTKGKLRNRKRHGKNELMLPSSGTLDHEVKLRKSEQDRRKN
jgi:hypothetical protein